MNPLVILTMMVMLLAVYKGIAEVRKIIKHAFGDIDHIRLAKILHGILNGLTLIGFGLSLIFFTTAVVQTVKSLLIAISHS